MRVALLLLLVARSAAADPLEYRKESGPTEYPAQLARSKAARIAGTEVHVLHAAVGSEVDASLAIHRDDGWYVVGGPTVEYVAANMTEAPLHVALVRESLSPGRFADGLPAIVYEAVTRWREIDARSGRVVSSELHGDVMVCGTRDEVRCARVAYTCPAAGCVRPTFVGGVLTTIQRRDDR